MIQIQDLERFDNKIAEVYMNNGRKFVGKFILERYPKDHKYTPNGIKFYHLDCDGKTVVFSLSNVIWIREV